MANPSRTLDQFLIERCTALSFYQALRLLENEKREYLLHPVAELGFPASEIRRINPLPGSKLEIQLNFMGLYGIDSPLPNYLTELCLSEQGSALKAFLDIFNHHLYQLAYVTWRKYRPLVALEQGDKRYLSYLTAIGGGDCAITDPLKLTMAGILGHRMHNISGLRALLQSVLPAIEVTIQTGMTRWIAIDQLTLLGNQYLSQDLLLGKQALTRNSLAIRIGPISAIKALTLIPGQIQHLTLMKLINSYLPLGMTYEIRFTLVVNQEIYLGKQSSLLGFSIIGISVTTSSVYHYG